MKLTKSFLIACGWADSATLDAVLDRATELIEGKGITDLQYIEKLLRREFPKSDYTLTMGDAAPLSLAIDVETDEQRKNLVKAETRIQELLRSPVVTSGSLMPDACPAGGEVASLPVGGVVVALNAIIPAAHSSDICCSMYASFYQSELSIDDELDVLTEATRFGPGGRTEPVADPVIEENVWLNPFLKGLRNKAVAHMADQGDGNHFAYLGEMLITRQLIAELQSSGHIDLAQSLSDYCDETLRVLVTHHGSRGLGSTVYRRGLDVAVKHCRKVADGIPEAAAWIDASSKTGSEYWEALQYVSRWTRANHKAIHRRFIDGVSSHAVCAFGNEHNFVWKRGDEYFHGKGATPAWLDESGNPLLGLIPMNMAEPILWVLGSDNTKYASFAPHGAGRNLSRTALLNKFRKRRVNIDAAIVDATSSIAVRWYLGNADFSETPLAYKEAKVVRQQIEKYGLARVVGLIQPRGSIMAGRAPKKAEKPLTPKQLRQRGHRAERRKVKQVPWSELDEE